MKNKNFLLAVKISTAAILLTLCLSVLTLHTSPWLSGVRFTVNNSTHSTDFTEITATLSSFSITHTIEMSYSFRLEKLEDGNWLEIEDHQPGFWGVGGPSFGGASRRYRIANTMGAGGASTLDTMRVSGLDPGRYRIGTDVFLSHIIFRAETRHTVWAEFEIVD